MNRMNRTRTSQNGKKVQDGDFLDLKNLPEGNKYCNIPRPLFKLRYLEQALMFNHHFFVMILVGISSSVFGPLKTPIIWINANIDFFNAFFFGVGVSGVICWTFVYKLKKEFRREVSDFAWTGCYILLNICHILSVVFVIGFFLSVGIKQSGQISSLACGIFSSMLIGIILSIKYAYKS